MDRRRAPPTEEGWFALHDFRRIDWDAWRGATERERAAATEEGRAYLESAAALEDADEGGSAAYAVTGHGADLALLHLRPTMGALNALERRLEHTALGGFLERADSFVSVTEVSGYTMEAQGFFEEGLEAIEDQGLRNYIGTRLHPSIPDTEYLCFYPMDKRRDPEYNWYDLPFEERAEHMEGHGAIGREFAGEVTQVITGAIGLDDWEWGVTLFADDPTRFKRLLYEMRFDPSTSKFAEFGPFYTGERLAPADLGAFLRGEALGEAAGGDETDDAPGADVRETLAEEGVYAGQPHGEDVHAVVLYSAADAADVAEAVDGLRGNFEHYDTHVKTAVYEPEDGGHCAVASIWETESAAGTASGFLSDLPGVVERDDDGFGTMGLFYTVEPEHREAFVETFAEVEDLLSGMEGHRETTLLSNREDEADMFIASRWDAREDAMAFFRSEEFRETVEWGRDVLADSPRHVFLA